MHVDASVPYRIASTGEQPISRTFWFSMPFTGKNQTANGLLKAFLKAQGITPIYVLQQLWFQYQGRWCRCDSVVAPGMVSVDFYLLEFIQN